MPLSSATIAPPDWVPAMRFTNADLTAFGRPIITIFSASVASSFYLIMLQEHHTGVISLVFDYYFMFIS